MLGRSDEARDLNLGVDQATATLSSPLPIPGTWAIVLDVSASQDPSDGTGIGADSSAGSETGRLVAGRYQLGAVVGRGGMATIYRAEDTRLGRTVALKLLRPEIGADRDLAERFRREALATTVLRHPNIVGCLDTGSDPSGPFMIMELVEGEDLAARLRRSAPMPAGDVARIGLDIARGLGAAHLRGIVHRDVKPSNILLARDGRAMITDFGIARLAADAEATVPGTTLGSVQYFSPEQAQGAATTPASDVYGLGLVMYEALTGRRPWHGDTSAALALARVGAVAPSPRDVQPDVPLALDQVVIKALSPDPADRYPSGNALAAAIEPLVAAPAASAGASAASAGAAAARRRAHPPVRRERRVSRVTAVGAVLVAVLTVGGLAMAAFGADAGLGEAARTARPGSTARPSAKPTPKAAAADPTTATAPTPEPVDLCRPILDVACALGSGRYAPAAFSPDLAFTLGDGWSTSSAGSDLVVLSRPEGLLTLASDVRPAAGREGAFGDGFARSVIAGIAKTPGVKASKPATVHIGGHSGRSVDITPTGKTRRAMFATSDRTYHAEAGRTTRLVALDVDGRTVLLAIEPTAGETLRQILDTADVVASTMAFR